MVWLGLCLGTIASAQESDAPLSDESKAALIKEIRVEGSRRVEPAAIARTLRQKVGQPFDPDRTSDDLRALWALKYFEDIQLLVQRSPDGIAYVVRVSEKPAIRAVTTTGNDELSKDDFKDVIDLKPFSILDVAAVKRNVKKIADKYVEKGFFLADVTYRLEPVSEGHEVDVVFVINERAKVMVKEISFLGNSKVSSEDLKAVMATREGGWLSFLTSEGTFREEHFQRDLQVIQAAYYDRGFISVRVDKPTVSLSPDKRFIYVSLRIEEGEQYSIGKLDFSGDLIVGKDELGKVMTSKEKEIFNRSLLAKDIQGITDIYYDQGYAYANINPVTAVNAEARTIDLTFDVQKGQQVTVERIEIVGNTKTRDRVIRRQLRVFEGDLFNGTGMKRSKEKVTALGFFETVEVTHKPGKDDRHVTVQVEVKEKSTGTFQVGMGFSNVESFIFTAQVQQQNFLGWGVSVSASAQISGLRQFFQLSYFDPYFLDKDLIFSVDAYRTQLDYFGFIRDAFGGTASLGFYIPSLRDEMSLSVGYTREFVRVDPGRDFTTQIPLAGQFRSGNTSSLKATWQWDRRNNRLFPTAGFLSFFSAETAPEFLGGTYNFDRLTGYQRFYVPLPFGAVFKTNLQAGWIREHFGGNVDRQLPISELFFLGGINTIRGYPLRTVAPTEVVPNANRPDAVTRDFSVGGDKQLTLNVELEFPVVEKVGIRGVLFYDAGNVFARGASLFEHRGSNKLFLGLYHSVGFGVRWFSPIGPLRFEWGIPLNRRPTDQPIQFEFTIGNSF